MKARFAAMILIASGALLGGCAYPEPYPVYDGRPVAQRTEYGVVESMELYRYGGGGPVGLGTILGGIAGGVIGHQFGSGRGNTAATIAGAGAGAYAGHQVEKSRNRKSSWSVAVRMDNGTTRTFSYNSKPPFRDGDRVKTIEGGKRLALVAN